MQQLIKIAWSGLFLACFVSGYAQTSISGSVHDKKTGEEMVGVSIMIEEKIEGCVSDLDGNFYLLTKQIPPFTLVVSYIGYERRRLEINAVEQTLDVFLEPNVKIENEIVVAASRISEDMLRSPITIEKLDGIEIRTTPSPNVYGALANLRGVQMNTSSLTFTSINTRGFADVQNWRFIQSVDGMEMNAPGLNYPVGTVSAPPDIDMMSMELVPGAGSALYGANAFNGMLLIKSKDPFNFPGFSAETKGGSTLQNAAGINPFGTLEMRYAQSFKNRFAFKLVASAMLVHDWQANDTSFHRSNSLVASGDIDKFDGIDRNDPGYNAVNIYGDEPNSGAFVYLGDTSRIVNRTGFREEDLVNYHQKLLKGVASLHYRINADVELSYDYRIINADAVLRHTTVYPMRNLLQQVHRLRLQGTNFDGGVYYSLENAGDSYYLLGTGSWMQKALKPDNLWANDYGAAYRGEINGVQGGDHAIARAYADRDMPRPGSPEFQALLDSSVVNPDFLSGGSKLVDRSRFVHAEMNYDFTKYFNKKLGLQAGGSFRNYWLNSEGSLFNDGVNGFNKPIPIYEFGGYVQASKSFFKKVLSLRASARFDKNQNFEGRFTPRASVLISMGKERNHNIRASFQSGFRNPATQEAFIALDAGQGILMGGSRRNLENYSYTLSGTNIITQMPAGTTYSGTEIHDKLVSFKSFTNFLTSGNLDTLQYLNLPYLNQEKVTTYELGYRCLIGGRFYFDAFGYFNQYNNFVTRVDALSVETLRSFGMYTNVKETIWSVGSGVLVEYLLPGNYRLSANYTYTTFNADSAVAKNPGFLPAFNTPTHRANFSITNRNVWKNLGFSIKFRWSGGYTWQSPFGQGEIKAYSALDAGIMYQIPKAGMNIKIGGTNLLIKEYKQVYGGPTVGSQLYIGIVYDPFIYRNKVSRSTNYEKGKEKEEDKERPVGGHIRF